MDIPMQPSTDGFNQNSAHRAALESKLLSQNQDDQLDAIVNISFEIKMNKTNQSQDFMLWLNNICLKLADLMVNNETKNNIRNEIVEKIFKTNAITIEELLINKDEFLTRI